MARRRHGRSKEAPELDITAFLNLMVVLVPFLLVSAVFSRITILELNMAAAAGGSASDKPEFNVEVIIRQQAIEIRNGNKLLAKIPKIDNVPTEEEIKKAEEGSQSTIEAKKHDLVALSNRLLKIKSNNPDKTDAMILLEPDIEYRHLVSVMDRVRSAEVKQPPIDGQEPEIQKIVLFPDISIGDAP